MHMSLVSPPLKLKILGIVKVKFDKRTIIMIICFCSASIYVTLQGHDS